MALFLGLTAIYLPGQSGPNEADRKEVTGEKTDSGIGKKQKRYEIKRRRREKQRILVCLFKSSFSGYSAPPPPLRSQNQVTTVFIAV